MEAIFYDGTLASIVTARRVYLAPEISELDAEHPYRRMVAVIALYARDVQRGLVAGSYRQEEAEARARSVLVPAGELRRMEGVAEQELARHFRVPVREIRRRQRELVGLAPPV